jgi:hypothetical protein
VNKLDALHVRLSQLAPMRGGVFTVEEVGELVTVAEAARHYLAAPWSSEAEETLHTTLAPLLEEVSVG